MRGIENAKALKKGLEHHARARSVRVCWASPSSVVLFVCVQIVGPCSRSLARCSISSSLHHPPTNVAVLLAPARRAWRVPKAFQEVVDLRLFEENVRAGLGHGTSSLAPARSVSLR
jgi:hypothetical protein